MEFKFKEEKTVSCLLNKYKDMKIILKFLFNLSSKSDLVEIRPLNSEYWLQFYFWEVDLSNNISISVGARYGDFGKKNVKQILNKIYSNKNYVFIIQNIIQNYTPNELLGEHMFSSSIRTLEGFYKRFWTKKVNHYYEKEAKHRKDYIDLGDMLPEYEKYFQRIVKDKIENWKEFSQILINTRNNFIHCNTNQEIKEKCKTDESQCVYLHERVLRDLSFLIDYVVSFLILSELLDDSTKSEIIIKKYVERWDREFSHILNKILHKDNREILDIIEET